MANLLPMIATDVLEKALNQCLQFDPESLAQVTALEGKVIAVELTAPKMAFYLVPTHEGLRVQSIFEGEADVTIRGGAFSLAQMGLGQSKGLLGDGVTFDGDTDLGRKVQRIIDGLDIDWEEQLSRLTGDVVAHQVGNFVRDAFAWGKNAGDTFGKDVAEYFQEESRDLVPQAELNDFLDAVDTVRMDVDRLEQRIALLDKVKSGAANNEGQQ